MDDRRERVDAGGALLAEVAGLAQHRAALHRRDLHAHAVALDPHLQLAVDDDVDVAGVVALLAGAAGVALGHQARTGRQRLQVDASVKRELWKDFFVGANFYNTYDSRPPNPAADTNDVGLVLSIGWSY